MIGRLIVIVLLWSASCGAVIRFQGNGHIETGSLKSLSQQNSDPKALVGEIKGLYHRNGFFYAQMNVKNSGRDTIIVCNEGNQFILSDLKIAGLEDSVVTRLVAAFSKSTPLSETTIDSLSRLATFFYADNGYPYAKLEIRNLTVQDDNLHLNYALVKGPHVPVGDIRYSGLTVTKPQTLDSRVSIERGETYRESMLLRSMASLSSLPFARLTGDPQVIYGSRLNSVDIEFPMADEKNFAAEGLFYLNPNNDLAGSLDLALLNLLGDGKELKMQWAKRDRASQKLRFDLLMPFFSGLPLDMNLSLRQEDRDSSFISTQARIGISYRLGLNWKLGVTPGWTKITPEEGREAASARLVSVELTTSYDSRDSRRQPRQGSLVTTGVESAYRRSYGVAGDIESGYSTIWRADLSNWTQLSRDLVLQARLSPFQVRSDFAPLPQDHLIPIGGIGTLRGYRENSFLADQGILGGVELQWFADSRTTLLLFQENAYIGTLQRDYRLSGWGAGMRFRTSIGTARFELAMGEEKRLDRLLVHFGVEGEF